MTQDVHLTQYLTQYVHLTQYMTQDVDLTQYVYMTQYVHMTQHVHVTQNVHVTQHVHVTQSFPASRSAWSFLWTLTALLLPLPHSVQLHTLNTVTLRAVGTGDGQVTGGPVHPVNTVTLRAVGTGDGQVTGRPAHADSQRPAIIPLHSRPRSTTFNKNCESQRI